LDGSLCALVEIDDSMLEYLESVKDSDLSIDIKRHREKRSIDTNAYLWRVCTDIAVKLGTSKESVYEMMLKDYGVYEDYEIPADAVPLLEKASRFSEVSYRFTLTTPSEEIEMVGMRCWKGSHEYNSKEFSILLDGCIQSAHDIGIKTKTDEEIDRLVSEWRERI